MVGPVGWEGWWAGFDVLGRAVREQDYPVCGFHFCDLAVGSECGVLDVVVLLVVMKGGYFRGDCR